MGNLGGQKVNRVLVPLSAQDFTPFAQQIKQQRTDLLFVAWAGTTAPAMWRALDQQGVFSSVDKVVTGLDQRASYPTFGPVASKISFLSHYVSNAPKNKVNDFLVTAMREARPAARPLHAGRVRRGPDDRAGADEGLGRRRREDDLRARGLELHGPEGPADDPASDHAMLQPMFQVKLVESGGKYSTQVHKALRARYTAPPEKK